MRAIAAFGKYRERGEAKLRLFSHSFAREAFLCLRFFRLKNTSFNSVILFRLARVISLNHREQSLSYGKTIRFALGFSAAESAAENKRLRPARLNAQAVRQG
jgi:hypothetical protein